MMRRTFTLLCFHRPALMVAAIGVSWIIGCSNEIPVYPVEGQVNFEGQPMAGGGSIALVPLTDQEGMAAGGEIAADGTYRLTTRSPGDGSMVGEFRVLINQVTEQEPENTEDG